MSRSFRPALLPPAALALLLGAWGIRPSQWMSAAQSDGVGAIVNGEAITHAEIEQRARLLALRADINTQARENFQRLVKSKSTEERMQALQREVIDANPGKAREELIAIFQGRQKELGLALQNQAVEEAREALMPKLRTDAREQLIAERLRSQAAKGAPTGPQNPAKDHGPRRQE